MCCARMQLWSQAGLVQIPALPLRSCITLNQKLEAQPLYLYNGDADIYQGLGYVDHRVIMCISYLQLHNK